MMGVKLEQAAKMLFRNPSLETVFIEAIANSLDAEATEINIDIEYIEIEKKKSFEIKISDNGVGFTEERFRKFSKLFDVDEESHKGMGRLVYLIYFKNIKISSIYQNTNQIEFDFNENFDTANVTPSIIESSQSGTVISMSDYTKFKVWKMDYLDPGYLKNRILEEFFTRLFKNKIEKKNISINITTRENITNKKNSDVKNKTEVLSTNDIPDLEEVQIKSPNTLLSNKFYLYYSIESLPISTLSIEQRSSIKSYVFAGIDVDNRTKSVELVPKEKVLTDYKMIFLLYSDWFVGKADLSRQELLLDETETTAFQDMQAVFKKKIVSLIEEKIPKIKKRNHDYKNKIVHKYPHLANYIEVQDIGYISDADAIKKAQESFFREQRYVLEATSLTEEQYQKSLELSAYALTEYILFRQLIIDKLKSTNKENKEKDIHNLVAPKRKIFYKENSADDLYQNNAWILDDKYMTYEAILSEREMQEVIDYITHEDTQDLNNEKTDIESPVTGKPDIALIFSNNPNENKKFDVVIVELKRRGITLENNALIETQLSKRARKLMKYYNNNIQRIWFYGVIEFNDTIEFHLKDAEYTELYSTGKIYYKEKKVLIQENPELRVPAGMYILDLDSIISDADTRNSVFLNLIKSKMLEQIE